MCHVRNIIAEISFHTLKGNMITHLQVNLSPKLLIQLFDAYFCSIRNARSQITGDGDVTSAIIKIVLK